MLHFIKIHEKLKTSWKYEGGCVQILAETKSAGTDADGAEMSSFLQFSGSSIPVQSIRKFVTIIFIFTA